MLNYRQSGHPGGSRSKVHALVATLLSGVMRWDIRHPEKSFSDRFILVAGHTIPLIYAALPILFEALKIKFNQTGDKKYLVPDADNRALYWQDLINLRHNGGLPGHAEMAGKTLFLKFNTGPSGHGSPSAAGEAFALKRAGAEGVRVFAFEGEGGLTPGAAHETMNSAWGLGLSNLCYVVDWNDFGIDDRKFSEVIYGTPRDWFGSHGWRVTEADDGHDWGTVTRAIFEMAYNIDPPNTPGVMFMKTKKGRGYLVYDNKSHGKAHALNSEIFWETKKPFMEKYNMSFEGFGKPAPSDPSALRNQALANFQMVMDVFGKDQALVDYVADTLIELGDSVPNKIASFKIDATRNPLNDDRLYDFKNYPAEMYAKPGEKQPNRAALGKFGAWVNMWCQKEYGRPLFMAMSADLADSTNISGFAKDFGDQKGFGWYERDKNPNGVLLPQGITEFTNAGISVGIATVNFSQKPFEEFNGFLAACSTYGSFVYLKYGPMRLFSQLAQDSEIKVGKVLWIAGHSGPETAEDSRTHFGIFAPGVTQLFPEGHIIDLHPWEHNEVPVVIAAALKTGAPIIALHLTRPPIEIPDREALGVPSHFEASKGAYIIRPYKPDMPRMGAVLVQGTSTTNNLMKILPEIDKLGLNVKIIAAISPQLFALQDKTYRERVYSDADRLDAMAITNRAKRLMSDWVDNGISYDYALSSDWDNRWRTGGSVEEVVEEAHLSPEWMLEGIQKFARDREKRLGRIKERLEALESGSKS
ncbi:MAG: transketolase [Candidatus Latescibacteria bacterium]|nr:transketolase [Candidatus Latescibacterota bacterium]NIM21773.1 transketolase [Candidatus Latescibacterota bacterium]NIM65911.1 transketolase [Candidatus Latescibacterota bacterium]NIO02656.1 transketolase [Candidatus Latescibacterota bacterium]NIO29637.1 transketolase [Candidatus Latescibacterota bacterium]